MSVKVTETSDHNIVVAEIIDKEDQRKIKKMPRKEMFYSNLLNQIKQEHLRPYLRYLL